MKILYLHQYFNTPEMQGGTRSFEMARRLVGLGHEVHMVTSDQHPDGSSRRWRETEASGIHVHWLPVPYSHSMGFYARLVAFFRFALFAASKAREIGGDVVFATSTPLTIALPAIWAAKGLRIPMVFEVRDLWPEVPIMLGILKNPVLVRAARWLEQFAYRNSARIVTLSPRMKERVHAAGYELERILVIPNGCDVDFFGVPPSEGERFRKSLPWLGDRRLVVYTGTMGQVNDVEYLARLACAVLPLDPRICFLVVGEGKMKESVCQIAREGGAYGKNFFVIPPVPKKEVPAVLAAADLAVSTCIDIEVHWQSSSQNKFFDALAAGVPVALNYRGWLGDLLIEKSAGLVLDRHRIDSAAELLVRSLGDEEWKKRARQAAKGLATERFNRDLLARQLEQILISVTTKK